jgi:hypothetical protein
MSVVPCWKADRHTIKEDEKALHRLLQLLQRVQSIVAATAKGNAACN